MSTFIGAKCNIKALVGGFSIIHLALERENLSDQRSTVFENHQKCLNQHCERSELCLHFQNGHFLILAFLPIFVLFEIGLSGNTV